MSDSFGAVKLPDYDVVRCRWVRREPRRVKTDKASGPDKIPNKVIKYCADSLAFPLTLLIRLMLQQKRWPVTWRHHWLFPIHKKGSRSDPTLYRAIHLTSMLSKVTEKALSITLGWYFDKTDAFGATQ